MVLSLFYAVLSLLVKVDTLFSTVSWAVNKVCHATLPHLLTLYIIEAKGHKGIPTQLCKTLQE